MIGKRSELWKQISEFKSSQQPTEPETSEPEASEPKKKKKRKGPKGPNPLSCKKKQKKAVDKLNGVKDKLESQGKRRKKKKKKNLIINDVI